MVTKVLGKINGQSDIIFTFNQDLGQWQYIVPINTSGEYLVQLWAIDEAGNESYWGKLMFMIDTTKLCIEIKFLDKKAKVNFARQVSDVRIKYKVKAEMYDFIVYKFINRYEATLVRCELCGRY